MATLSSLMKSNIEIRLSKAKPNNINEIRLSKAKPNNINEIRLSKAKPNNINEIHEYLFIKTVYVSKLAFYEIESIEFHEYRFFK